MTAPILTRCPWARREPSIAYHDEEWGVKQTDDRALFELLTLEGAQAGLSWETILNKRAAYRAAFDDFDPSRVALFDAARIDVLVGNAGIVRHRGKIASAIGNARAFQQVQAAHGSFSAFLWSFTDGRPVVARRLDGERLPASTPLSDEISLTLRKLGFTFVGTTIMYAFLQACGVVDDHFASCFRASTSENLR